MNPTALRLHRHSTVSAELASLSDQCLSEILTKGKPLGTSIGGAAVMFEVSGTLVFANAVGNDRLRRVKEKTGARLIEVRAAKFVDPTYTEHETWELNKQDWNTFRASCR